MTRAIALPLAAFLLLPASTLAGEARPMAGVAEPYKTDAFDPGADPMQAIDAALAAAETSGKRVLLVMGTNGCHDSAWLANLIATDRFAPVRARYQIVFADIGMPHAGLVRHPEVPKRFGFRIKGTPTVAILDAKGHVLNRKAAPKWRNAASRSDDKIYAELMEEGEQ
ncbi:thioredoxin family protein [Sphingopyxis sp.]|uniref:thioredoxin family protein n=1 Tax=Sphingopyxis sp. TaxID=1908224 RepID=UPI0035B4E188